MEEDGGESGTPFWVQSNAGGRRGDGVRRRVESAVFNSGILVFLLVVGAVFFMVFVLPWTASFSSGLFRASSVKKSWDSVNVVLVFLAIVFGVLSRSKNEFQKSNPGTPVWYGYREEEGRRSNPAGFDRWVESSDRRSFNGGGGGLRRSFSSYPDLCEMSPRWVSADDQWRFYDDTRVDASRVYDSGQLFRRRSWRDVDWVPEVESNKIVYVDTVKETPLPAPSSPPPPQAAAEAAVPEPVYKDLAAPEHVAPEPVYKVESKRKTRAHKKPVTPSPPAASPPPPPPPPPLPHYVEPKSSKSERKRSSSSGTKGFIISSLYHKRKRKQRSQSVDNLDALLHTSQPPPLHFQFPPPSPPPPPPPPPPPSVFQNLFSSKKTKRKKNVILAATPPPSVPPPPPPPPPAAAAAANPRRTSRPNAGAPTVSRHRAEAEDEKRRNIGGESPLIPIPPPPPPPPFFKKSAWKFVVQGDYVRIDSLESSRSGSPDLDELESDVTPTAAEGGGDRTPFPQSPLFCPSPDVNTKAENFISKFRAGLKLEKMNSMKKQGLGLSNLGPSSELS